MSVGSGIAVAGIWIGTAACAFGGAHDAVLVWAALCAMISTVAVAVAAANTNNKRETP